MKKISTLLLISLTILLSNTHLTAQTDGFCGSELSEKQKGWLLDFQKNKDNYNTLNAAQNYIPLFLHIVGNDNGTGYYSALQLMSDVCQLNEQFAPVGFYFYLAGVDYIANTAYHDHEYGTGYQMMIQHNKTNAANAYIVQDPAGNCGYFAPATDGIALKKDCMGNNKKTMVHEFGHFFSLPHPFENVLGQKEYVNGSNCKVGGDLFCDTRADILNTRWTCPYNGTAKDPLGTPYNPDGSLYMSYSDDACATNFSNEQIAAMKFNLANERPNLNGPAQDTMPTYTAPTRIFPAKNMAVKPTNVKFAWKPVPNAKWYVLQVSHLNSFPGTSGVDIITQDTFYTVASLLNNKDQFWRVKPIFPGRTCTQFSNDTGKFVTSSTAGIEMAEIGQEVLLYPNPTANGQEVLIAFTAETENATFTLYTIDGKTINTNATLVNTTTYTLSTTGIKPGVYMLDITNGEQQYRKKLLVE